MLNPPPPEIDRTYISHSPCATPLVAPRCTLSLMLSSMLIATTAISDPKPNIESDHASDSMGWTNCIGIVESQDWPSCARIDPFAFWSNYYPLLATPAWKTNDIFLATFGATLLNSGIARNASGSADLVQPMRDAVLALSIASSLGNRLAAIEYARSLVLGLGTNRDLRAAISLLGQTLSEIQSAQGRRDKPLEVYALTRLGYATFLDGNTNRALQYWEQADRLQLRDPPPANHQRCDVVRALAMAHSEAHEWQIALPMLEDVVRRLEPTQHYDRLRFATALCELGHAYYSTTNYVQATNVLGRAVHIMREALPSNDPTLAWAIFDFAVSCRDVPDYPAALLASREAREMCAVAFGSSSVEMANALYAEAAVYHRMRDFDAAEPLFCRALDLYRQVGVSNVAAVTDIQSCLGTIWKTQKKYSQAKAMFEAALRSQLQQPCETQREIICTLLDISSCQAHLYDYDGAEDSARRALSRAQAVGGQRNPDLYLPLYFVWNALIGKNDLSAAAEVAQQMVDSASQTHGAQHRRVAETLNHLALTYSMLDEDEQAYDTYRRSLDILESTCAANDQELLRTIGLLGRAAKRLKSFDEAEILYKRQAGYVGSLFGVNHENYADVLMDLGALYSDAGDHASAQSSYQAAITIYEHSKSSTNANVARAWGEMADVLENSAQYTASLGAYERAVNMYQCIGQTNSADFADLLYRSSSLNLYTGDILTAERDAQQALAILDSNTRVKYPNPMSMLLLLRQIYSAGGRHGEAVEACKEALRRQSSASAAPDSFNVADVLSALAQAQMAAGDYSAAQSSLIQALGLREDYFGPLDARLGETLFNIAQVCFATNDFAGALEALSRARALTPSGSPSWDLHLQLSEQVGSVTRWFGTNSFVNLHQGAFFSTNTFADLPLMMKPLWAYSQAFYAMVISDYSAALSYAEQGVAEVAHLLKDALGASSEQDRLNFMQSMVMGVRSVDLLFAMAVSPSSPQPRATLDAVLWHLRLKGIVLDSMLEDTRQTNFQPTISESPSTSGKNSPDACETNDRPSAHSQKVQPGTGGRRALRVTIEDVQNSLSERTALVEFAHLQLPVSHAVLNMNASLRQLTRKARGGYIAVVIRSGQDVPALIDLGDAAPIDALVRAHQEAMRKRVPAYAINRKLYEALWRPIYTHLQDIDRVLLSPDGELNFLSFATLIDPTGHFLVQQYDVGYLASGRDLVWTDQSRGKGASLFGDPTLDRPAAPDAYLDRGHISSAIARPIEPEARSFADLPGSRDEVTRIAGILEAAGEKTAVFLGDNASEAQLRTLHRPRMLHLATHGVYLDNGVVESATASAPFTPDRAISEASAFVHSSASALQRTGIALSQHPRDAACASRPLSELDDGFVTAAEIATLDLQGTEIVALSACDTAMGPLTAGEGVIGLRRAVTLAGARSLILTLWPVEDQATATLMVKFYKYYMESGDVIMALSRVQRETAALSTGDGDQVGTWIWGPFVPSVTGKQ